MPVIVVLQLQLARPQLCVLYGKVSGLFFRHEMSNLFWEGRGGGEKGYVWLCRFDVLCGVHGTCDMG